MSSGKLPTLMKSNAWGGQIKNSIFDCNIYIPLCACNKRIELVDVERKMWIESLATVMTVAVRLALISKRKFHQFKADKIFMYSKLCYLQLIRKLKCLVMYWNWKQSYEHSESIPKNACVACETKLCVTTKKVWLLDRQTPDTVIPMCCYASQATQQKLGPNLTDLPFGSTLPIGTMTPWKILFFLM